MNAFRLILRNLAYFRASSLAVVAGMAVATAALTGALMVGDSVRGSLQMLAVQRLGLTEYALVGTRFFDDSLAQRFAGSEVGSRFEFVPGILVNGGASVGEGAEKRRTGDVQIAAMGGSWAPVERGGCILNGETADALGLSAGPARMLLTFPSMEEAPREAAVARRGVEEAAASLVVERVAAVTRERGMLSLFNLAGGQRTPRNAWVNLKELQDAVGQGGRANVLLVREKAANAATEKGGAAGARAVVERTVAELDAAMKRVIELADYGLEVRPAGRSGEAMLAARGTYLPPAVVTAAETAARVGGFEPRIVTVSLVNAVAKLPTESAAKAVATSVPSSVPTSTPVRSSSQPVDLPLESSLHYVIGAGISRLDDGPLAPDEIALNEFTAQQLGAQIGDRIRLDFFQRESAGELKEVRSNDLLGYTFKVVRVLPMTGLGADGSLTPQYKGLTDAPSVSSWNPPKELGIVGEKLKLAERDNDEYWKKYKAAPRLFIHIDTARKLWGGPYGDVTGVRIPADRAEAFAAGLKAALEPKEMSLAFRAVKAEQLAAASGGTDFSELFLYFSFFLIVAAALLVAMLFRLTIEQRARQLGLLAAVGFTPGRLRKLALQEGLVLAIIGGAVGSAVAVAYTWAIVYGLRTRWVGAVGTTALELYVQPLTIGTGFTGSLAIALLAVLWGVWRVAKLSPSRLLAGAFNIEKPVRRRTGRATQMIGIGLASSGVLVLTLVLVGAIAKADIALVGGALLLCGTLAWLSGWLRPRRYETAGAGFGVSSITVLGVRNASRHTARSVLSVALIAFAAFTLITVASMQRNEPDETGKLNSGSGGYPLIVQAGVPILSDLNTPSGRERAGVREPNAALWQQAKFLPLRRWAGQDISCLNLTRPDSPTILGVPKSWTDPAVGKGHRFSFAGMVEKVDNPWALLERAKGDKGQEPDTIPVITDAETAEFILKLSVGGSMPITDQTGKPRRLRLVATLSHSIFQSEMLMSEANFRRLFPTQAGFGTILVEVPANQVQPIQQLLNNELDPYAVSVDTTAARLATYKAIINTYLDTFRVLGSLGLALGSIGLAVVLVRNVIERRPELALLAALGFRPAARVHLVLSETAFLLVVGLAVGTVCALLGVTPAVVSSKGGIAWGPLALTLLSVLVLGFVASAAAVWLSSVRVTPADLRRE